MKKIKTYLERVLLRKMIKIKNFGAEVDFESLQRAYSRFNKSFFVIDLYKFIQIYYFILIKQNLIVYTSKIYIIASYALILVVV